MQSKQTFFAGAILIVAVFCLCGCSGRDPSANDVRDFIDQLDPGGFEPELGNLIDLGDLLWPEGDHWYLTKAVALNNQGIVVGASNQGHGIFLHAFKWDPGTQAIQPVGPDGVCSSAVDINNSGSIIGNVLDPCCFECAVDGFIDDHGSIFEFGATCEAIDINDLGHVALSCDGWGLYWDGTGFRGLCGIIGADTARPVAINENLHAVINSGTTAVFHDLNYDKCESLNYLPGATVTKAVDINDSRYENHDGIPDPHIIGNSGNGSLIVGEDASVRGFFWDGGAMYPISDLGGGSSQVADMNNSDQVVGGATTAGGSVHAFLWSLGPDKRGIIRDLGTLGGANSFATAINEAGQVAGYSDTGATYREGGTAYTVRHAFLWDNGVMYDLGIHNYFYDYAFVEPYPFSEAVDINDNGQVTGNSITINSHYRGFFLSPVFP